jgi:hypothetical protein
MSGESSLRHYLWGDATPHARLCCLAGACPHGDNDAKSSFYNSRRVADCRVSGANGHSVGTSRARWSRPPPVGSSLRSIEGALRCSPANWLQLRQASGQWAQKLRQPLVLRGLTSGLVKSVVRQSNPGPGAGVVRMSVSDMRGSLSGKARRFGQRTMPFSPDIAEPVIGRAFARPVGSSGLQVLC